MLLLLIYIDYCGVNAEWVGCYVNDESTCESILAHEGVFVPPIGDPDGEDDKESFPEAFAIPLFANSKPDGGLAMPVDRGIYPWLILGCRQGERNCKVGLGNAKKAKN